MKNYFKIKNLLYLKKICKKIKLILKNSYNNKTFKYTILKKF